MKSPAVFGGAVAQHSKPDNSYKGISAFVVLSQTLRAEEEKLEDTLNARANAKKGK
jgi:hypothetical protein